MDTIERLGSQLSQVTMYDIKSYYNQAKNMVLNVSEMEAKVREATNDDPWGASSTLMLEIAQATFNFQQFNEIMPCIYSRFMEKEASQWRQIYKALQLLEYIIKHGSERVVDDARSHISTIKMLRNFHYIDDKGKDQGINVRNRARELAELLNDVEKIRGERRKAKANRSKYTGTGNDGMSFSSGSGGRYGGFGSESYSSGGGGYDGGGSGGGYGGGGGSYERDYSSGGGGGGSSGGFRDSTGRKDYDEYDAGDDDDTAPRRSNSTTHRAPANSAPPRRSTATASRQTAAVPAPKPAVPEVDLLGGFDEEPLSIGANKALPAIGATTVTSPDSFDDEFGDFSAAPASPPIPQAASPLPAAAAKVNIFDMLGTTAAPAAAPPSYTPSHTATPSYSGQQAMNMFASPMAAVPARPTHSATSSFAPMTASKPTSPKAGVKSPGSSSVGFDDLWNLSLGTSGSSKPATPAGAGKSIKDLEKEKALAGIWGTGNASTTTGVARPPAMGMGMGSFGGAPASSSGGGDDLLL